MKNDKQHITVILSCLLLFCFTSCKIATENETTDKLVIAVWNAQAMFDGNDDGTEFAEYRFSAGWSDEKYRARLQSLASAVEKMHERSPDILGLVEIENERVLEDLVKGHLTNQAYRWTFFGKNPEASFGIGLLSRFPLETAFVHSVTMNGETTPRPVLEARITIQEHVFVFFVCHWKSKLGGERETDALRRASAGIVVRRVRELREKEPDVHIIVMGDLNENHDEFFRRGKRQISALVPDDPIAVIHAGSQKDFLVVSPAIPQIHSIPPLAKYFPEDTVIFYSPWNRETEEEEGSYNYRGNWESIDHFLLSPSLFTQSGWAFESFSVVNHEPFSNKDGHPYSYNPRTGNGLSDHFPLLLSLAYSSVQQAKY